MVLVRLVDAQPAALKFGRWVPAVVDLVNAGKLGKVIADVECLMVRTGVLVVDEGDARMPLVVDHVPEQQIIVTEDDRTVAVGHEPQKLVQLGRQVGLWVRRTVRLHPMHLGHPAGNERPDGIVLAGIRCERHARHVLIGEPVRKGGVQGGRVPMPVQQLYIFRLLTPVNQQVCFVAVHPYQHDVLRLGRLGRVRTFDRLLETANQLSGLITFSISVAPSTTACSLTTSDSFWTGGPPPLALLSPPDH
uniref:Uncharacterized protein n=1 Tax=Anopheles merus TaxID=30066 RepID=A0A182UXT2_ANOME